MRFPTVLAAGALALAFSYAPCVHAQNAPPVVPIAAQVTAQSSGAVTRYIVGPMGHVRGFVLDNGVVVFVNGRQGDAISQQVPVGQSVHVEGNAQPNQVTVIHHANVWTLSGTPLTTAPAAMPPAGGPAAMGPMMGADRHARRAARMARLAQLPLVSVSGAVTTVLAGPRGGIRGVLLSDGSSVFFGGPLVRALRQHGVQPGENLRVVGHSQPSAAGTGVFAESVTFADGATLTAPPMVPSIGAQPTP